MLNLQVLPYGLIAMFNSKPNSNSDPKTKTLILLSKNQLKNAR